MKRIGYIDGRRLFLADGQAISFGTDKDIAVSFNASLDALEFGGAIYLPTDKKLLFRDANSYIYSSAATQLDIYGSSRVQITSAAIGDAIVLTAGANGGVTIEAYLKLKGTDTDCTFERGLWYDTSEDTLKFKTAATVMTVITMRASDNVIQIPASADIVLSGTSKLRVGSDDTYIYAPSTNNLDVIAKGYLRFESELTGVDAIRFDTGTGGGVNFASCYICLGWLTSAQERNGSLWYNTTTHQIRAWVGNGEVQISTAGV